MGKGSRNLGLAVTASYQEVLNPHDWDINLYETTTNPVAQWRDYTRMSGLNDAVERLEGVEGFGTIRFTAADVVRHPIVGRIVEAYEGEDEEAGG